MYNSDLGSMWGTITLVLIVSIIIFLLCRELICWYYKINRMVVLMEDQNELLRKLLVKQNGIEDSKEIRISEKIEEKLPQPDVQISDEILMKRYNISFENEKYVYSDYRYDNLKDAVNYARQFERKGN
jgi:hypothetical protein